MPSQPRPLWPAYLATFTFMLGQWVSGIAVPLHVVALGGSAADAGTLAAIRFGLGAVFQLPFGALADAWGARRVILAAVLGNALVNLVPLAAETSDSLLPLYVWAVLSGITASLFLPATSAYVAVSAPEHRRGSSFGWLTLGTHAGVASGPAVGGWLWEGSGPIPTYVASAVLGVVALVGPALMAGSVRTRADLRGLPGMVAVVARERAIVGTWLAALAIGLPWGAVAGLFPLFGTSIGVGAGTVGLLLALQSIINGVSRVPLGRLLDRSLVPPVAASATALSYGALMALLGLQTSPLGIALVLGAGMIGLAFTLMLVQVVISEAAPPHLRATALGGYGTSLSAGLGLGPLAAGVIADGAGFPWSFGAIGVAGAVVAAVAGGVLAGTVRGRQVVGA